MSEEGNWATGSGETESSDMGGKVEAPGLVGFPAGKGGKAAPPELSPIGGIPISGEDAAGRGGKAELSEAGMGGADVSEPGMGGRPEVSSGDPGRAGRLVSEEPGIPVDSVPKGGKAGDPSSLPGKGGSPFSIP